MGYQEVACDIRSRWTLKLFGSWQTSFIYMQNGLIVFIRGVSHLRLSRYYFYWDFVGAFMVDLLDLSHDHRSPLNKYILMHIYL